tara:strand:- start:292 stop:810 length:519 start_codon:yes stop_codon:yes gene_type:complete
MELETRNQKKRVQAAMSPVIVAELSNQITLDDARSKMARVERHTVHSPWTREVKEWCKAMKRSMSSLQGKKHFDDYWLHSAQTQDAIRRSLFVKNFDRTKKLFCIAKNNSHLNGYFAFRPVSVDKADEVYDLVACMKVLSDANDHEYKHYVRLYKWMEREMALSTRQEERKE